MRVRRLVALALLVIGCERIVGMEDALPPTGAGGSAGADAGSAGAEAGSDASDAAPLPDAGSPKEHVPCEGTGCVCNKAPVASAEGEIFKDVAPTTFEAEAVQKLHAAGVIGPCDTNPLLFCPSCQLSRSAIVKWLVDAAKLPLIEPDVQTFSDVPKNHPFYAHIETAFDHLIAVGFADGTFRPNEPLSRASAAVMVQKAAELPIPSPLPKTFDDVSDGFWAEGEIEALFAACVTTGCPSDGAKLFCPDTLTTRRGGVVMIARAFGYVAPACTTDRTEP